MGDFFNSAKKLLEPDRPKEWHEEVGEEICAICPSLSYQQRLYGCLTCFIIGLALSIGSIFR